ncbi:hypothetical protein ARALYDRAFT_894089 [Arabidopsis lyrata subsp. lyrata]|uniref:Uncharacterized protein n=1 Tax=Arabidopsis lyrata subsp. lyrata TaxID=81972 RepID=D7KRV0_ARALL|nr:hypothetical protein ARALYDRAFT_894089 [Arabidopsis lyrata subsp. lyrata]
MLTTSALESELQALIIAMHSAGSEGGRCDEPLKLLSQPWLCIRIVGATAIRKYALKVIKGGIRHYERGRSHFGVFNWIRDIQPWKKRFQDFCKDFKIIGFNGSKENRISRRTLWLRHESLMIYNSCFTLMYLL